MSDSSFLLLEKIRLFDFHCLDQIEAVLPGFWSYPLKQIFKKVCEKQKNHLSKYFFLNSYHFSKKFLRLDIEAETIRNLKKY